MASSTVSMFSFIIIVWVLSRSPTTDGPVLLNALKRTSNTLNGKIDSHRKLVVSNPEFLYKLYPASLLKFNRHITPKSKTHKCALLYLCILVIVQAHDCQPNPGPNPGIEVANSSRSSISDSMFPCHLCHKACLWGERSICCDHCEEWYHVDCLEMHTTSFEIFTEDSKLTWMCWICNMPNFASSLFKSGPTDLANTLSNYTTSSIVSIDEEDLQNLKSPIATSSPQHKSTPTEKDNVKDNVTELIPEKRQCQRNTKGLTQEIKHPIREKKKV